VPIDESADIGFELPDNARAAWRRGGDPSEHQ
jgi:hypothetical protein